MASEPAVTCQIRYTLILDQLGAFQTYPRAWMVLMERYGGVQHRYFVPRANPDLIRASFPDLGYDGPTDVAVAMFTFPTEEAYRRYRETVGADPESFESSAMANLRSRLQINKVRRGVPLDKLERVIHEARLFLEDMASDLEVARPDDWGGIDFRNGSLSYTAQNASTVNPMCCGVSMKA